MHGRGGEERKRSRHMCSVPPVAAATLIDAASTVDSSTPPPSAPDSFSKDGRKISVGDCALFQSGNSPPFIGIIRSLISNKEDSRKLSVNWLYRPVDIKLSKGISLEAAPNEVFYSFHKDEISAASLLHPCKVAFLHKGVELPSGVSSFVCRRVYDIQNKCLWWLTDQDYVNERQEEVDQLLDRTRLEMHTAVQSGARSPKPLNVPTSTQQSKPSSDTVQNSINSYPSQGKGKKREKGGHGLEPIKRERQHRTDDGDSDSCRLESLEKDEITKITEEGGLINFEGVEKLIHIMHLDRADKKINLAGRIMLSDVIAATDKPECLDRFVQLMGVPVLDDWLQEAHKGRVGDGNSLKENEKCIEEFLLALLRALDKLPVNLHALQTSNIGKSVNNLRSHKNLEIQKKARTLVDTWKKRVNMEMKINDAKSASNQSVSWHGKPSFSEASHGGNRSAGSSEVAIKSVITHPSGSKTSSIKLVNVDIVAKSTLASPGTTKSTPALLVSATTGSKDSHYKMAASSGTSDIPLTTIREEKSSSSSQSQNNSQSFSSDHAKNPCKEDARSSTAGSMNAKTSSGSSRTRKSNNGFLCSIQKESILGKPGSQDRNATHDKISQVGPTSERMVDNPVDFGHSHRLIVRLPNPGRSPARSAIGGSFDDPSALVSRASSPGVSDKHDYNDRKARVKSDIYRSNVPAGVNTESWQSNDVKNGLSASDEVDRSPTAVSDEERIINNIENAKLNDTPKTTCSSSENGKRDLPKSGQSLAASFSMNALVESCVKYSEVGSSLSVGDDGMNLLASVATGEISKSEPVSPSGSPEIKSPRQEDTSMSNCVKLKSSHDDLLAHGQGQLEENADGDPQTQVKSVCSIEEMEALQINNSETCNELKHKAASRHGGEFFHSSMESKQTVDPCSQFVADPDRTVVSGVVMSNASSANENHFKDPKEEIPEAEGTSNLCMRSAICVNVEKIAVCKVDKDAVEEPSPRLMDDEKMDVKMETTVGTAMTENLPLIVMNDPEDVGRNRDALALSTTPSQVNTEEFRPEKTDCMDTNVKLDPNEVERVDETMPEITKVDESDVKSERKEALEHCPSGTAPDVESPSGPVLEAEQCKKSVESKLSATEVNETEECLSTAEVSPLSNAIESGLPTKLDFDLNEGFPAEEGSHLDPAIPIAPGCTSADQMSSVTPISSLSCSLPASVTVAAAAKGPFVHPENLLKCKGELGWRGSAATSAFRPAEPRKVLEMTMSATDATFCDNAAGKHGQPSLNIDLNVPDARILEDMASRSSIHDPGIGPGTAVSSHNSGHNSSFISTVPISGGLELDLNRADEETEIGQPSLSRCKKYELLPVRSSSSGGFSNDDANVQRGFDLNNGPGDEAGVEIAQRNQPANKSSRLSSSLASGPRINNAEVGGLSSWFPPVSSYPAVTIPQLLQDRGGDQVYHSVANTGAHRILGSAGGTFGTDPYRGQVLSSSALVFPPAASYQYAPYPFNNSFALTPTSFPGGSAPFMDSSGGVPCFPAVPSQLMGPAGAVSSHYPRPYVISLPESSVSSGAESSRKWGRQSLDLNAGPGNTDVVARDERMSSMPAQLSVVNPHGISEENARIHHSTGGPVKRKEPEGGWEADRFSYKQPSWQ